MSYTNGIGSPQQVPVANETVAPASIQKAVRPEAASGSSSGRGSSVLSGTDNAKLSTTASVVGQALTGSDVRTERVAALQQSIAAGTYSVSSSDVADKLMTALLK